MNRYVSDTMALILRLEKRKIPQEVKAVFQKAEENKCEIIIPTLVFAELAYLSEKGRIDCSLKDAEEYMSNHKSIYPFPISFTSIKKTFTISDIPELHDRLIAGVAYELNLPIITNDPKIQKSKYVKAIWG